ncbi:MAG: FAD-dependent oxidoreductase [Polyangiaceae bacterium]
MHVVNTDAAPHAVVIGSGIGGATTALLLAHAGIRTTLLEKNRRIGGSCSGYDKRGFHIDIGTHMFCRGAVGPLGDVLRRVGQEGAIRFKRTRDIAEVRFPRRGAPVRDAASSLDEVTRIAVPADVERLPRFAWELCRALELSPREALRAARFFTHVMAMSDVEVAEWDDRTVEDLIRPFTDHPGTIGVFGFLLGLYFILPYWEVSAGEALWSFRRMVRDNSLSYPEGGSISVPGTYCRLAEAAGAEVRTGAGVRRILMQGGRVSGVELEDGTRIDARIVVSTSSMRTTVKRLVGVEHFPAEYVRRAEGIRGSYIAVQAKIALSRKLVEAGAIVGGVGDGVDLLGVGTEDLKAMFESMASGRVPSVVPFYCPVPTNFDASLAPPGCQLLTACAVAPTSDVALKDPAPLWEEAMMRALRRVVPGSTSTPSSSTASRSPSSRTGSARSSGPPSPPGRSPVRSGQPAAGLHADPRAVPGRMRAGARGWAPSWPRPAAWSARPHPRRLRPRSAGAASASAGRGRQAPAGARGDDPARLGHAPAAGIHSSLTERRMR